MPQRCREATYAAFVGEAAAEPGLPLVPLSPLLNGRYRLEQVAGRGGLSTVYQAQDLLCARLGSPSPWVAIKVISDRYAQQKHASELLLNEFARVRELHHPGVVRAYHLDVDGESQRTFMCMEWLEGKPLAQWLRERRKALAWDTLKPIALSTLAAVAYIHSRAVVHGDLKPGNFMLSEQGLRVFDFGLSELTSDRGNGLARLQRDRTAAWTPAYAALELLEGGQPTMATDVYALGCVLYELATGRHPYERLDARQARAHQRLPVRPSTMPQRPWVALRQAMSINPAGRCITAQELQEAFRYGERVHFLSAGFI